MATEVLEFAYTKTNKIPEHHRTIAFQYAIGMKPWDIAGGMGIKTVYVEKVLAHPPIVELVLSAREILDMQVLGDVAKWTGLLGKAITAMEDSLVSENERIRLTAALEYLNRHPSTIFVARKPSDGARDTDVMDNAAIKELKLHAQKIKGESEHVEHEQGITEIAGVSRALPAPAPAPGPGPPTALEPEAGPVPAPGPVPSQTSDSGTGGGPIGSEEAGGGGATVPDPVGWPPESAEGVEGGIGEDASDGEEGRSGRDSGSKTPAADLANQDPV